MLLEERITKYLATEHADLRLALDAVSEAVGGLRPVVKTATPAPAQRKYGPAMPPPQFAPPPEPTGVASPRLAPHLAVRSAWEAFDAAFRPHLTREDRVFEVALRVLGGDRRHQAALVAVLRELDAEHATLRQLAKELRAASMLHEDARRPVTVFLDAYDAATRVQEIALYPALLADSAEAFETGEVPIPEHYRSADSVLRNIRSTRPSAPEREANPEPPGLLDRLKKLFGG